MKSNSAPERKEIAGGQVIQYIDLGRGTVAVYLGTPRPGGAIHYKKAGVIRERDGRKGLGVGFQYIPAGLRTGGDLFGTLADCKRSLEAEP